MWTDETNRSTRREFLRDLAFLVGAGLALGSLPFGGTAFAQTAPVPAPGWLEDETPGQGAFGYALPINPYELSGEEEIRRVMDLAREAGADGVAVGVFWPIVQPSAGAPLALGPVDAVMRLAEERGMTVSVVVNGTPDWVHPDLKNTDTDAVARQFYAPIRTDGEKRLWQEFLGQLVRRYRTRAARYVIWNEPNNPHALKPYPRTASAGPYATLLALAYRAIKAAEPAGTVTFGGLSVQDALWFQWFYDAVKKFSDAAARRHFFDEMDFSRATGRGSTTLAPRPDRPRATGRRSCRPSSGTGRRTCRSRT